MRDATFLPVQHLIPAVILAGSLASIQAAIPAFPGAEGFGKYATGGRNGTVYHVTNTNDAGTGSFRVGATTANCTIVFDVGGVIRINSLIDVANNVTIAGQTAPGDGITVYGHRMSYSGANHSITRFLRCRMGVNGDGNDTFGIADGHDMIFDHCSVSWGQDETFSINGDVINITIQSTMISQGLQTHSAGGLIQTDGGVSILRSLYIDNDTRNPKVKGTNEFVNNVVCNWETIGYNMGGDSSGESCANVFNNYFLRGPASSSSAISGGNTGFHIYATNNWYDGDRDGVLDGSDLPFSSYGSMDLKSTPFAYPITNSYSPLTALKLAISDVGTSFKRDYVDQMMISQLTSWGLDGGTITSELLPPMHGPGVIRNGTPYADTDQDGMPDFWENGTGSNPNVANNNDSSPSGSGYTRLEDYLNWLAEPHGVALQNTNVVIDLRQFTCGWVVVNHGPAWSVSNAVNGTVSLVNGYFAQFVPTSGLNSNASFTFTVTDSDGGTVSRTMNLFFTPAAHGYSPVWHGDDLANNWNALGDYNWFDGISLLYRFQNGDAVAFDDTGSTNPAVNLVGSLQPASVTVGATRNYGFSGSGSLDGTMTLLKTNTGALTLHTVNGFTGNTLVSNGTLLVHGALKQSAVTASAGSTVGGSGSLGNGLTLVSGATVTPGNGIGAPGTLTVTNTLTESGGVTNRFDLSDDPTGLVKTNDVIRIIGDLTVSGNNLIKISLLDGLPGNGVYTLFTYTGNFNGSLANFTIAGASGTLTNPPGAIAIIVNAVRPPATLIWKGDGVNNIWDTGTNANWLNDGVADRFYFLDDVVFDSTGSTNPAVSLAGDLTPNSVTVDAAVNYTFGGSGKITGTTGLTKTNSGALSITTANDFTGPVVLGGGTVAVSQLANGGAASPLGAATSDPGNLQFFNSSLQYSGGSVTVDRGATFASGGATFNVTGSGTTVTWNGTNVGDGTLIKSGPGTLTLSADNRFTGGTLLDEGTVALYGPAGGGTVTANNYALGSGSVTFQGGTLKLFGNAASTSPDYGTFSQPLMVPTGETGTLLTPPRYTLSAPLSGGGTLNLEVDYVRGTLSGNWSAFTGRINVTGRVADSEFRVANTAGYAGASLYLYDNVVITRSGSSTTVDIGTLGGTSGSRIGPGNDTSSGSHYRVGWRNEDAVFAGRILADGVNAVTKVGTGNWRLGGASTYTGGTVVDGGTLTVNNTSGSGTGTAAVTVNTNATLAGTGILSGAITLNAGATLSPGDDGIGTLTVNNSVTLAAGSTSRFEINKTAGTKDSLNGSGALTYGGILIVTNLSGTLTNGDSFKLFNGGTYAGSFASSNLPPLAPDLMWNTATLNLSGTLSVVSTNFTGPQPLTWVGDGTSNLWDTGTSMNWLSTNGLPRAFLNGDTVTFDNSGSATPAINLAASASPAAMMVNASQDYTLSGVGALTGTMPLTKSGAGKLTLANTGANNFSGGTAIAGGALQIGDGASVNGSIAGNIANNGTLIFNNPGAVTYSGSITGSGQLTKRGAGALTLGTQSYTNATVIEAGTLTFSGNPPPGNVTNTGTLNLNFSSSSTYAALISGSGNVNVSASGQTNTFTGASSYSGGTTNTSGTLVLAHNTAAGSGPVTYLAGAVRVNNGVVVANTFVLPSSTSDLMMDSFGGGTGTWAGDIVATGGGASFRPGGTLGTLVLTGTAALGGRNFIVPRGTVEIGGSANFSATGSTVAFGRNTTGNSSTTRIKQNAVCAFGPVSLGGGSASGGTLTLQIQDSASFTTGINNFDIHSSTRTNCITVLNLNGGTFTVGGIVKSSTASGRYFSTNNFNGGALRASQNNPSFLPALSELTCLVKSSGAKIDDGGYAITIAAPLLHDPALGVASDGGLVKLGSGTLTLSGASTFTGPTVINAGTLALASSGSIAASTNISVAAGAVFDVNSVSGYTLGSGRMLWGNGTVNGNCTLGSGAILAPGSNAIGALTFNHSLILAAGSTNLFEISHSPLTNDAAVVAGALTAGGTLVVTNLSGALAAGDSFKLFNAGSYSIAFTHVILPSLNDPNLAWNTNALATNGLISVVSAVPPAPPFFNSASWSDNRFIFSVTGGVAGTDFYLLSSTNPAVPSSHWTRLLTNQFDSQGSFNFTNSSASNPQSFYLLQVP
jgi:autotransporter-associated beta strand protein